MSVLYSNIVGLSNGVFFLAANGTIDARGVSCSVYNIDLSPVKPQPSLDGTTPLTQPGFYQIITDVGDVTMNIFIVKDMGLVTLNNSNTFNAKVQNIAVQAGSTLQSLSGGSNYSGYCPVTTHPFVSLTPFFVWFTPTSPSSSITITPLPIPGVADRYLYMVWSDGNNYSTYFLYIYDEKV